eukprot:CAMPEP_0198580250 /NCGR_PEP_ID=MMETSP1462-20131121/122613_1 /TAXON_ID=1333877 /ORGANISM="Brandtodinium nutriculum, Strain RCC3387" /LENGTH=104 /DNA_ID=CAMNT_0044311595 /DNA_START=70 /DNA_END=381 /DNA_ORIENTATION=+
MALACSAIATLLASVLASTDAGPLGIGSDQRVGACNADADAEEAGLIQVHPPSRHVPCPGDTVQCAGAQCCPGINETDWKTFPCPSAPADWNACEGSLAVARRP